MSTILSRAHTRAQGEETRYQPQFSPSPCPSLSESRFPSRIREANPQQAEVLSVHQRLSTELGRPPSVKELRAQCKGYGLESLGLDRYRAIIKEINHLPNQEGTLTLTQDRPFFVCYARVREAFNAHVAQNHEPPHFQTFLKQLKKAGLTINETSLKNIITDIRDNAEGADKEKWRFSRKRLEVSWPQIEVAYTKAETLLKKQKADRAPAAEEVSYFLKQEKINISPRALEFRFSVKPETVTIALAPYSDTTLATIRSCHRALVGKLQRNPAIGELTALVNKRSIKTFSPEAVWMRVTHFNQAHPRKQIKLTPTLTSGIYDSDIKLCHSQQSEALKRPPTFQELFAAVKLHLPTAVMREDTFHRRLRSLSLALTHENALKSQQQREVEGAIRALKGVLKRAPLRNEVVEHLAERGLLLKEDDFCRVLATLKRRMEPELRSTYHLAFPHRSASHLIRAYDKLARSEPGQPSIQDMARMTRWSDQGVTQMLKTAQRHAAQHGHPVLFIRDAVLTNDLSTIKSFAHQLEQQKPTSLTLISDDKLKSVFDESLGEKWSTPEFYNERPELTTMRLQVVWLLVLHHHLVEQPFTEIQHQEAHISTIGWALRHEQPTLEKNPFTGIPLALKAAVALDRLSKGAEKQIVTLMNSSVKSSDPLPLLIQKIDQIAQGTGYHARSV